MTTRRQFIGTVAKAVAKAVAASTVLAPVVHRATRTKPEPILLSSVPADHNGTRIITRDGVYEADTDFVCQNGPAIIVDADGPVVLNGRGCRITMLGDNPGIEIHSSHVTVCDFWFDDRGGGACLQSRTTIPSLFA